MSIRWVNIKQAAEHMGINPSSIYNGISVKNEMGALFYNVPGSRAKRADLDEIDAFMKGAGK